MNITRLITLLLIIGMPFSQARAGSEIDERRDLAADGRLQVENLAGSVTVTTWDKAELHISGELGDEVEKLEILETSSGVQVRVRNRRNIRNVDATHLRLTMPASASLSVASVSADLTASGLSNQELVLTTVSGDIEVQADTGRLELESVSGDIRFSGNTRRSAIETVSGRIDLTGLTAEISVSTVSGDVKLTAADVSRGRFETVSGKVALNANVADGGRLKAQSMSGDVVLVLPASQQAEFSAQTFSGKIRTGFGKASEKSFGAGSSLSHRQGSNGASIGLESFSGDIRLEKN